MRTIASVEELEALYGQPNGASTVKEIDWLHPLYLRLIEASPFVALATAGPEGLDCSPRGDAGPVVRVLDERTLALPDRRGNNRADSLKNIVRDPRCALLFLIPGSGTCLRVNGRAVVSIEPALLESFAVEGQAPRSVVVMTVERVYFQCARAVVRSGLWKAEAQAAAGDLPTPGQILAALSDAREGGEAYDREWPGRAARTLW